jgi:hypothetical protein
MSYSTYVPPGRNAIAGSTDAAGNPTVPGVSADGAGGGLNGVDIKGALAAGAAGTLQPVSGAFTGPGGTIAGSSALVLAVASLVVLLLILKG